MVIVYTRNVLLILLRCFWRRPCAQEEDEEEVIECLLEMRPLYRPARLAFCHATFPHVNSSKYICASGFLFVTFGAGAGFLFFFFHKQSLFRNPKSQCQFAFCLPRFVVKMIKYNYIAPFSWCDGTINWFNSFMSWSVIIKLRQNPSHHDCRW